MTMPSPWEIIAASSAEMADAAQKMSIAVTHTANQMERLAVVAEYSYKFLTEDRGSKYGHRPSRIDQLIDLAELAVEAAEKSTEE